MLRNIKKYQAIEVWIRKPAIGFARGFYFHTKKMAQKLAPALFAHYYGSFLVINQVLLLFFNELYYSALKKTIATYSIENTKKSLLEAS